MRALSTRMGVLAWVSILAAAGSASAGPADDFSGDTGLWTYKGSAYRDAAGENIVLTPAVMGAWGQAWLNAPRTGPFYVRFRYRAGGGSVGGDGLVFLFYKSMDYSPTVPDWGGSLGFSREPHGSLLPVPGYGVEFDSVYNLAIYNDPSIHHIALIQDQPGNHLAAIDDDRVADDLWHTVEVQVKDASVEVAVDGDAVLSWSGALDRAHGGIGFSAATGSYTNLHLIDDFSISDVVETRVVDNGDPGTSSIGYWPLSSAEDPYGGTSLYARNGASYAFTAHSLAKARYNVLAWWTTYPSRSTQVPIEVEHAEGNSTVFVDQTRGGGGWNLLGNYAFDGSGSVRVLALGAATTCADAVAFVPTEVGPPPPEAPQLILDDGDPGTSALGSWSVSSAPSPHGGRSLYSKSSGATYTYSTPIHAPGLYEVYAWWTAWPSRSSQVPIEVRHADGTSIVEVSQLSGGGQWNLLGR